jgi:TrmH family RNA methyltransferase
MITSKDNNQIKELRKLQQRRARVKLGRFAAEGEDLIEAALANEWSPVALLVTPEAPDSLKDHAGAELVEHDVLASASSLGSGARAAAIFDLPDDGTDLQGELSLYVDNVADPGNVGTLVRSAAAFADSPLRLGGGCADPYSPKALRAAMGLTFANPPVVDTGIGAARAMVVALDASGDIDLADLELPAPVVICAGGEREGLSRPVLEAADVVARIPMRSEGPESLNVAMAATIALYEAAKKLAA